MSVKVLWELGEIYTTPLDWFLVLLGIGYSYYKQGIFFDWRIILFLLVLFMYHIAMNIFNNYMDYKNALDEKYKRKTSTLGKWQLSLKQVKQTFFIFFVISLCFGAMLVAVTDYTVFILGLLGYSVGLGYSYGRKPINSLPIAETIPAIFSGFIIPLLSVYLTGYGTVRITTYLVFQLLLVCMPMFLCMFNNLLANNTCDLDEDVRNGRKTLVYYIGKQQSVYLLILLTLLSYAVIPIAVYFKQAPLLTLGLLFFLPRTIQLLQPYYKEQIKKQTFPFVLKSMSIVMIGYPLLYLIGAWL